MRPYLDVRDEPDRVTLKLEMSSILSAQAQARLQAAFGSRAEALFGDALTVLSIVAMEETVTHRSLRYRVGMHAADLSALLKSLCQQGFLTSAGRGSGTSYALHEVESQGLPQNVASSTPNEDTLGQKVASSPLNEDTSRKKVASSGKKVASSAKNVASSAATLEAEETQQKLPQALLAAAANGWRTVAELAAATNRSSSYLRSRVIPALVSAGLLERRYPDATHPNQAYRSRR